MNQLDSFPAPNFPTVSLKTEHIPGISQFLVGTSSRSPSITLNWAEGGVETVLP